MTAPPRLGRYEIVRRIGKSMTDVYLAIDTVENRKAALKLIKPTGDAVTRMVLEAERRGAAILKELRAVDPRVVEVYDYGDLEGYFFVAMQYVEGKNLAEVIGTERMIEPVRAAAIALELCEQLAKFHNCKSAVVHGDIKPSNIHLGLNDTVRLLDFGIAKTLRANTNATIHNFGSPSYCSPERLTRSEVDQQSDLWAVGATLYEMLCGVPPYRADSTRKLESLIRSRRPPRALPPGVPPALRLIVMKALAPNPEQRYCSAAHFQQDLQAFLEHKPTLAEHERRSSWSAGATATMQAARACLRKVTRVASKKVQAVGAAAWFLAGMVLFIGGTYAWQAWHTMQVWPSPAAPSVHIAVPNDELPAFYIAAADPIFDAFHHSIGGSSDRFDWQKAELCLARAVSLGATDDRTLGRLALARGFATLQRLSDRPYSRTIATQLQNEARADFTDAARRMPDSADAPQALARLNTEQKRSEPRPKGAVRSHRPTYSARSRRWR